MTGSGRVFLSTMLAGRRERQLVQEQTASEALALWQSGGFALVITDCNMQEMDGYALARAIREIEAKEARPRTPIIAWTANVLPGAEVQGQAAGMDDILTKPAELAALKETISKWQEDAATGIAESDNTANARSSAAPIDLAELDKIAASAAERAEILLDFTTQTRSDLVDLRAAVAATDLPTCARIGHRVKGSSRMIGARGLATACETMERAARLRNADGVMAAITAIERALERLDAHLAGKTMHPRRDNDHC